MQVFPSPVGMHDAGWIVRGRAKEQVTNFVRQGVAQNLRLGLHRALGQFLHMLIEYAAG